MRKLNEAMDTKHKNVLGDVPKDIFANNMWKVIEPAKEEEEQQEEEKYSEEEEEQHVEEEEEKPKPPPKHVARQHDEPIQTPSEGASSQEHLKII